MMLAWPVIAMKDGVNNVNGDQAPIQLQNKPTHYMMWIVQYADEVTHPRASFWTRRRKYPVYFYWIH